MTVSLGREATFRAVSPTALTGFVRSLDWVRDRAYGEYSDVYTGEGLPEIIVPRTQEISDYGFVVSRLLEVFAEVSDVNPETLYRRLINGDRDVIRIRIPDVPEGSLRVEDGVSLVSGARDLLLSAACSFEERRPVYRMGSNRTANEYLSRVRLGQTEEGSFTVTLLPPVVPPVIDTESALSVETIAFREPFERSVNGGGIVGQSGGAKLYHPG